VSGTDKISITGAYAPQAFLGNFPNIQTALAAAGAAGTLAYSAAFVTGENSLYVFKNTTGALNADDMVNKMTGVTSLAAGDLLLGSQSTGATITLTAAGAVAGQTGATTSTSVDGVASATANLTAGNDTVNSTVANLVGSTATAGVGSDTLALSITSTAANGAEGTLSSANLANVTGFEAITLANFTNSTTVENVYNITVANANIADNSTLTVTSSMAGLKADGNLSTAGVTFDASGVTSNRKLSFTGAGAHDVVLGGAGNDTINGGDGNDTITGGAGVNSLSGGAGNDTIIVNAAHASTEANVLAGGTGVADTLQIGVGGANLTVDLSGSTISGFENLDLATNVATNALTLTGAQYASFTGTVSGNSTNDTITLTTVPATSVATGNTVRNFSFVEGTTFSVGTTNTAVVITETGSVGTVSTAVLGAATYSGTWTGWDADDIVSLPATGTVTSPALQQWLFYIGVD
jgi:S-layer protein